MKTSVRKMSQDDAFIIYHMPCCLAIQPFGNRGILFLYIIGNKMQPSFAFYVALEACCPCYIWNKLLGFVGGACCTMYETMVIYVPFH